jgi:hypothetical protein
MFIYFVGTRYMSSLILDINEFAAANSTTPVCDDVVIDQSVTGRLDDRMTVGRQTQKRELRKDILETYWSRYKYK